MDVRRREVLKSGGGMSLLALVAAAGWLKPGDALAQAGNWNKAAFETHSVDDTVKAMGGSAPAQSKDIAFVSTPDIAENGAVVPIGVTSSIPKTESIAILVEKNPNVLAAIVRHPGRHRSGDHDAHQDGPELATCTRSSRPTASTTSRRRKSRSRSAAAEADHGRSDENPRQRRRRLDRGARCS